MKGAPYFAKLTHLSLATSYGAIKRNIGFSSGLLLEGTKPMAERVLTLCSKHHKQCNFTKNEDDI